MAMSDDEKILNAHYAGRGLEAAIRAGLRAAGKDNDRLVPDDLAEVDQFHLRGKEATLELAHLVGLQAGLRILDVGGGLGGPARTLASEFSCSVTVLDVTEAFCRVGEMLTARTGLSERVRFQRGNALEMPFTAEVRRLITDSGLTEVTWLDVSTPSSAWIQQRQATADTEKQFIQQALEQAHQNKSQAAKLLGLSRTQLRTRMRHCGLE